MDLQWLKNTGFIFFSHTRSGLEVSPGRYRLSCPVSQFILMLVDSWSVDSGQAVASHAQGKGEGRDVPLSLYLSLS